MKLKMLLLSISLFKSCDSGADRKRLICEVEITPEDSQKQGWEGGVGLLLPLR